MSAPQPDVSIIIAAWRAVDEVGASIRSALDQEGVALEVIVVDDASPDDTLAAAEAAAGGDPRVTCTRLETNSGPSGARNRALDLARGRYAAVLDSDDTMAPGRLARLVAEADQTGADIVVDNLVRLAPGEENGAPFLRGPRADVSGPLTLAEYMDPDVNAAFGGALGFLKPLFRMAFLNETGLRYDPALRNSEDYYLVAHALARGAHMTYLAGAGYRYTVRDGSLSHRLTPNLTGAILRAETAFQAAYADGFDPEARAAARRRLTQVRRSHDFESVVAALKARRPGAVLGAMARGGPSLGYIGRRLSRIALAKATGGVDPDQR